MRTQDYPHLRAAAVSLKETLINRAIGLSSIAIQSAHPQEIIVYVKKPTLKIREQVPEHWQGFPIRVKQSSPTEAAHA
jgi:hypothetical protein